jgi:heme A synthase
MRIALFTAPLAAGVATAGVATILHAQDMWLASLLLAAAILLLVMPALERWSRVPVEQEAEPE